MQASMAAVCSWLHHQCYMGMRAFHDTFPYDLPLEFFLSSGASVIDISGMG